MKAVIAVLVGLLIGILFTYGVLNTEPPKSWVSYPFSDQAWEADPALPIPSLAELTAGARDDTEALTAIRAYYEANAGALKALFQEDDDTRVRGFFGMYIVHNAVPYNRVEVDPVTLLDFVSAPTAHCGTFALALSQVYTGLGLHWRSIVVDDGWHGLNEVLIGGHYETFDATNNLWLSASIEELIGGVPRSWRTFYTAQTDANAGARYRDRLTDGYNMPLTRTAGTQWGLTVFPTHWEIVAQSDE